MTKMRKTYERTPAVKIRVSWHHGKKEKRVSQKKEPKRLQKESYGKVTEEQLYVGGGGLVVLPE